MTDPAVGTRGGAGLRPWHLAAGLMATMAIASSSVLVDWASAPAVALAFWRTLGGAAILGTALAWRSRSDDAAAPVPLAMIAAAGAALGFHFWTWLSSLEMTSVAASVTLVSTAPLFVALGRTLLGDRLGSRSWVAVAVMFAGAAVLATEGGGEDAGAPHDLVGDALALCGAATMAVYLELGGRVRARVDTARYAGVAYLAAAAVLVPAALVSGEALSGFDDRSWAVIGLMILGPQLAGHTVLNALLERLGSFTVSLLLLAEPVGATVLAWSLLDQRPGSRTLAGMAIVLGGLALHLFQGREPGRPADSAVGSMPPTNQM